MELTESGARGRSPWAVVISAALLIAGVAVLVSAAVESSAHFAGESFTVRLLSPEQYAAIRAIVAPIAAATLIAIGLALILDARRRRGAVPVSIRLSGADHWPLAVLTAVGAILRAVALFRPIRTDEADTLLYYATQPWTVAASVYGAPNNHILYTLLTRLCFLIAGPSSLAIRIPAFMAGVLVVPATWIAASLLAGREEADRATPAIAAAIAACSLAMIDYSALARGYSLTALLTVISIILAALMRRAPRASGLLVLPLSLTLAIGAFTIPTMFYGAVAVLLWTAAGAYGSGRSERRLLLTSVAAAAGLTAGFTILLYLPVLRISGASVLVSNRYVQPLPPARWLPALAKSFGETLTLFSAGAGSAGAIALLVAVVAGFFVLARRRSAAASLWIAVAATLLVTLALQRVSPFPRVWLMFFPLVAITVAAAVVAGREILPETLRRAVVPGVIAALILFAGALTATGALDRSREAGSMPDAHAVATYLQQQLRLGDRVAASSESDVLLMYEFRRLHVPLDALSLDAPSLDRRLPAGRKAGILPADAAVPPRLFIVTNGLYAETPQRVLSAVHLDAAAFRISLRQAFTKSAVYEGTLQR